MGGVGHAVKAWDQPKEPEHQKRECWLARSRAMMPPQRGQVTLVPSSRLPSMAAALASAARWAASSAATVADVASGSTLPESPQCGDKEHRWCSATSSMSSERASASV